MVRVTSVQVSPARNEAKGRLQKVGHPKERRHSPENGESQVQFSSTMISPLLQMGKLRHRVVTGLRSHYQKVKSGGAGQDPILAVCGQSLLSQARTYMDTNTRALK